MSGNECVTDPKSPNLSDWEGLFAGGTCYTETVDPSEVVTFLEKGDPDMDLLYVGSPTHDVVREISADDYCKITESATATNFATGKTIEVNPEQRILYIDDLSQCPVSLEYVFSFDGGVVSGETKNKEGKLIRTSVQIGRPFILFPENGKLSVDQINDPEEDDDNAESFVGGGAANGAFDVARLIRCAKHLIGKIGNDETAAKIREKLRLAGIIDNTTEENRASRQSLIYVLPNKDRIILTTNPQAENPSDLQIPKDVAGGGTAHVFSQHNVEDFNSAVQALFDAKIDKIGLTPSSRSEMSSPELARALEVSRVFATNSDEAVNVSRTLFPDEEIPENGNRTKEDLRKVAQRLVGKLATAKCHEGKNAFVAISDSWHGSFIIDKEGNVVASLPYKTEGEKEEGIENRMGAGDAWTAVLTYILLALEDIEPDSVKRMKYALYLANVLSGNCCMEKGPNVSKSSEEIANEESPMQILVGEVALAA